ncbi:carbon monoxide dehydrogenase subunit G [Candidatus Pelagibacter sp.]|nr:carbon monoxide dehydrogenase subunit G [Candidatus Pelagibacter sp.]
MKLSGSYQIKLEKQKVWEALNNPEILKKAIPGCEEFIKKSDTEFIATAKNKIGPFNASFTGDIELKDIDAPNSYKISGSGNSPVGFASGEADVKLEDINGETNLIYTVDANVGGKIAQVGSRLIDMTAKKMADVFFGKFSELISPSSELKDSNSTEEKVANVENVKSNKINKKIILYPLVALIIIIVLYNFF